MNNDAVKVTADKNGNIIVQHKNPLNGYIRLTQEVLELSNTGWLDRKTRTAFIKGAVTDLVLLHYTAGKELPGNIVIKESLCPFNSHNPKYHLKINPTTGEVLTTPNGENIYRDMFWDPTGKKEDILIAHGPKPPAVKIEKVETTPVEIEEPVQASKQLDFFKANEDVLIHEETAEIIELSNVDRKDLEGPTSTEPIYTENNFRDEEPKGEVFDSFDNTTIDDPDDLIEEVLEIPEVIIEEMTQEEFDEEEFEEPEEEEFEFDI
jgi:hypothetical protein